MGTSLHQYREWCKLTCKFQCPFSSSVLALFTLILLHSISSFAADVSQRDVPETLKLLVREMRDNQDKIHTLSGSYSLKDVVRFDGEEAQAVIHNYQRGSTKLKPPVLMISEGEVHFSLDVDRESLFSDFATERQFLRNDLDAEEYDMYAISVDPTTGKENRHFVVPFKRKSIVTPEQYLSFDPDEVSGRLRMDKTALPEKSRVAFVRPVSDADDLHLSYIVDPRKLSGANGEECWQEVDKLVKAFDDPKTRKLMEEAINISKLDQKYIVSITFKKDHTSPDSTDTISMTTTYDGKFSFLPTSYYERDSKGNTRVRMAWTYEAFDGLFVPATIRRANITSDGKVKRFERTLTLNQCDVNPELSPDAFSLSQFELANGERVANVVEDKVFVFDSGNLVPAQHRTPAVASVLTRFNWLLFGINIAAIVLLAIALAKRKGAV